MALDQQQRADQCGEQGLEEPRPDPASRGRLARFHRPTSAGSGPGRGHPIRALNARSSAYFSSLAKSRFTRSQASLADASW